jgi:Acyltransferase
MFGSSGVHYCLPIASRRVHPSGKVCIYSGAADGVKWSITLLGYLAKETFHAVLVKRNHFDRTHNPLLPMVQVLDYWNSLILFPEGTRGKGEALQPFKSGSS